MRKLNYKHSVSLVEVVYKWIITEVTDELTLKKISFVFVQNFNFRTEVHRGKCFNLESLLKFETPQEHCQLWPNLIYTSLTA